MNLFWQGSRDTPARDRQAFTELWINDHFITLLSTLFFAASGAIEAIAREHRLPEHVERQNTLAQELTELVEEMGAYEDKGDHTFERAGA